MKIRAHRHLEKCTNSTKDNTEKYPKFQGHLTNKFTKNFLEQSSITYSITRKPRKNKFFHGTSFYSMHPHYRWHIDLQDMTIFRKAAGLKKGCLQFHSRLHR